MDYRRASVVGVCVLSGVLGLASSARAQCALLVRESFRTGVRPHGGNMRDRDANIHDTLKSYWAQIGGQWMTTDQTGVPGWAFAGASLDPVEIDALDPYNGVAWGEPGAVGLLPFIQPGVAFTISADIVPFNTPTSGTILGYTSNPQLANNFVNHGALWIGLNASGQWEIRANGLQLVASGTAPVHGLWNSGWLHVEMTYDPAAGMVSGRVMNTIIPPTAVTLTTPMIYVGMEAFDGGNAVNNLTVRAGTAPSVQVSGSGQTCVGGTVSLQATTNAPQEQAVMWRHAEEWPLVDGVQPDGSIIAGSRTLNLTVSNVRPGAMSSYVCEVSCACGLAVSEPISVGACAADFNCSGGATIDDIFAYLNAWFAGSVNADVDGASGLGVTDIFAFLNAWFSGC